MWNRSELKRNAKSVLARNFWLAVLVCFIVTLLFGDFGNGNSSQVEITQQMNVMDASGVSNFIVGWLPFKLPYISQTVAISFFGGFIVLFMFVSLLFQILFVNPLVVGKNRYFIESIEQKSSIGTIFHVFTKGNYWNIVKIMLYMDVKILLWTLCFILPGIVKGYQYYFVPYLLAEDGSLSSNEVFERTRIMSDGNKFDIFVLQLSFIGWVILCAFTFGIGNLFLNPYQAATYAQLYYASKQVIQA